MPSVWIDLAKAKRRLEEKKSSSNIARDFNNSSYLVSSPRKPRFVLVPIRFASEAWPQPGLPEPRSASIVGFGNTGPLSLTEQKGKDCHDQDKQAQGASFGFVFGTLNWYDFWRRSWGLPCSRPFLPIRCWFDAFLHWNSAAEEGAWVGLKPVLQGGTGFNLLSVQFWPPSKRKRV